MDNNFWRIMHHFNFILVPNMFMLRSFEDGTFKLKNISRVQCCRKGNCAKNWIQLYAQQCSSCCRNNRCPTSHKT